MGLGIEGRETCGVSEVGRKMEGEGNRTEKREEGLLLLVMKP